ncbi:MAG: Rieske 2Fe-2S domain-containing protein [Verrucomicrobia bacterium]|nr:Rieske 2Fe-2S domain-containing protein [Verrucomicrobiota bacterium]
MSTTQPIAELTRRRVIKQFSLCTAASIIGGKLWTARLLASLSSGGNVGVIKIRLSDYPALQNEYGSVQFKFNNAIGTYYPFTVTRAPNNVFHSVDTRCNHADCVVNPYNESTGLIECPCHGSQFSISGELVQGPATAPLVCYNTIFNATTDVVSVEVPALYTTISTVSVQSTTASSIRLRLQFKSLNNTFVYRVQYQQTLTDAPVFVNFSNSAGGLATQSQVTGNSGTRSVFVDATGTTGFFAVVLVVQPYTP